MNILLAVTSWTDVAISSIECCFYLFLFWLLVSREK